MSVHQKQNMMHTSDGTVVDQKTREEAMVPTVTGFHASPVVNEANSFVNVAIEASTPSHAEIMFEVTPYALTEPQHVVGAAVPVLQHQHSEMQNVSELVDPVSGMSVESVQKSGDRSEEYELSRVKNSSDLIEPICGISIESLPLTGSETEISKPAVELEHNRCSFDPLVLLKSSEVSHSERSRESITASSDSGSPDYDPVVVDIGISELMLGEPNPRLAVMVCMEPIGSDSGPEDGEADNGMDSRQSGIENWSDIAVSGHQSDDILSKEICSPGMDTTQAEVPVFEPSQKDSPLVNSTLKQRPLIELTQSQCPQSELTQTGHHVDFSSTNKNSDSGCHPLVDLSIPGSETQYTINLDLSDHVAITKSNLVNPSEKRALESCNISDISVQDGEPVSGQQQQNADSSCDATVPVAQQHSKCAPGSEDQVLDVTATAAGGIENSALFQTTKDFSTHVPSLTHSSNNSVTCFDSEHSSDLFDTDIFTVVNSTFSHKHPDDTLCNQSHSEENISCLTNSYKLSDSSDPHIPSLSSDTTTSVLPSDVHAQCKYPAFSSDNFTSARNWGPSMNRGSDSDNIPTHKNEPLTPKCISSVQCEDIDDESANQMIKGTHLDSAMIVPQDAASASATSPHSCSGSDSDVTEVAEFPLYVSPRLSQEALLSDELAGTLEARLSGDLSSTQESQLSVELFSTQEARLSGELSETQEAPLPSERSGAKEAQLSESSACGAEELKEAEMKDTKAAYDGIVNGLRDEKDYEEITETKSEPSLRCQRMIEEHMPDATSSPNHLHNTIDDEHLFQLLSMSRPQVSNSHPSHHSATRKSKDDSELKHIEPSLSTAVTSSAASSAATVTNLSTVGLIANNDEGDPFASQPVNISDAVQRYLQQDVDELSDCLSVITERTEPEDDDFSEISEGLDDTVEDEELDREIEKIYQANISIESYCSSDSFGSGSAASAIRRARRGQQKKHIEEVLASPSSFELPVISEGLLDRPIQSKHEPSEQKSDIETIDKVSITSDTISAYLSDMSSVDHSNRQTPTSSILVTEEEVSMRNTDRNGSDTASEDQDSAWFDMSLSVDSVKEVLAAKNSFPQDASMSASTETLCDEELPQDDVENVGDDSSAPVPQVPEPHIPEPHVLKTQVPEPQVPEPHVPETHGPKTEVLEPQVPKTQVPEADINSKQPVEENKVAQENVFEKEISDCLEQVSTVNAIDNAGVPESDTTFPSIPLVPGHDLDASSPPSETLHPISNPSSQPNLHLQDQPVTSTSATAASPSSSPPEYVGVNPPVMSDRTSETESHGDDSGHISGTSAENTPEHKSRHHSHLSIPSLVLTSTSAEEPQDREEEDEDIDDLVATHKSLGSLRGSRGNLYSSLTDSRESLYSVYSDAGEINFGKIPATGEILFGLDYNYKTGALEIHVKQCKDIAPVDTKRNRSDPYVKTYLLPDKTRSGKRKTKIKKHTLNPTFDEVLRYVISKSEVENRVLWVTVWHHDRFGRNDFLGEVMIPMDCYKFGDASPKWYPLQDRLEAPDAQPVSYKGDLVLSIKFVTADNLENDGSRRGKSKKGKAPPRGELQVLVKEAKNLTAVRSNGSSDPFCKAYLLPEKHKSSKQKSAVVKRNCNPTWNHVFLFEDVSQEEMKDRSLELTIWDYDKITSNDFLGGVRLNLGTGVSSGKTVEWMDARGEEIAIWQSCMDRPNCWNDGTIGLRATMGKSEIRK
ncbi:uncharacterized protein [Haliotis asinina]|uniref:uncharacterized protein isoform X2 n=1 Tax=Haliotis asinina TaxID=109174 RepID=UPI003531EADC